MEITDMVADKIRETRMEKYKEKRKKEMIKTAKKLCVAAGVLIIGTAIITKRHNKATI